MYNNFDDFDATIQPEELQCDNPIDEFNEDYELQEAIDFHGNNSFEECDDYNDGENW